MRISKYIRDNEERILREWESAAGFRPAGGDRPDRESLQNNARQILRFVATDIEAHLDGLPEQEAGRKPEDVRMLEAMMLRSAGLNCVFDTDGRIMFLNNAMASLFEREPEDLKGRNLDELDAGFASEVRHCIDSVCRTRDENRGEFTISAASAGAREIDCLFTPIRDGRGRIEAIAMNAHDTSERKDWERTLWKQANHDQLTGVPNRRLFVDRVEQDMRFTRRAGGLLALLYLDLDRFKAANDRLGRDGGDALLQEAAQRIRSCIRETDTVARLGGDEFAVTLVDAGDRMHVEAVARAILARLSRPYSIRNERAQMDASIGIALYPEHGETVEQLTAHADEAMYAAKNVHGERFCFYSPRIDASLRKRLAQSAAARHDRAH